MTRAILGHPERDVVALNRLGRAYQAVGSIDDARAAFSRALENRSPEHHRRPPDAAAKGRPTRCVGRIVVGRAVVALPRVVGIVSVAVDPGRVDDDISDLGRG